LVTPKCKVFAVFPLFCLHLLYHISPAFAVIAGVLRYSVDPM